MDGPKASTGQHGDGGFRHHGHVDDDAVAAHDTQLRQGTGHFRGAVAHLGVGQHIEPPGHRAVPDQGGLIPAAGFDVAVEGIVASVQFTAREPLAIGAQRGIEGSVPSFGPGNALRRLGPPGGRVAQAGPIGFIIGCGVAHAGIPSTALRLLSRRAAGWSSTMPCATQVRDGFWGEAIVTRRGAGYHEKPYPFTDGAPPHRHCRARPGNDGDGGTPSVDV